MYSVLSISAALVQYSCLTASIHSCTVMVRTWHHELSLEATLRTRYVARLSAQTFVEVLNHSQVAESGKDPAFAISQSLK